MSRPVVLQSSRDYGADVQRAFDVVLPIGLEVIFRHGFGPLPPIKGTKGQGGAWATPGQTRTVLLGDGSQVSERLTAVEAPRGFRYELTEPTGAMRLLVARVDGEWTFVPTASGGTTVTWRWKLHPRTPAAVVGLLVLGAFWRGYAKRALAELVPVLDR